MLAIESIEPAPEGDKYKHFHQVIMWCDTSIELDVIELPDHELNYRRRV